MLLTAPKTAPPRSQTPSLMSLPPRAFLSWPASSASISRNSSSSCAFVSRLSIAQPLSGPVFRQAADFPESKGVR
ncbi:hypothetical protein KC333_g82 [Hortaea werneckii]|nr:hypothetical protein KC333_g82 [Hortaea werneckii]